MNYPVPLPAVVCVTIVSRQSDVVINWIPIFASQVEMCVAIDVINVLDAKDVTQNQNVIPLGTKAVMIVIMSMILDAIPDTTLTCKKPGHFLSIRLFTQLTNLLHIAYTTLPKEAKSPLVVTKLKMKCVSDFISITQKWIT